VFDNDFTTFLPFRDNGVTVTACGCSPVASGDGGVNIMAQQAVVAARRRRLSWLVLAVDAADGDEWLKNGRCPPQPWRTDAAQRRRACAAATR